MKRTSKPFWEENRNPITMFKSYKKDTSWFDQLELRRIERIKTNVKSYGKQ